MRIYFRNPELVITDRAIVHLPEPQTEFAITELHDFHIVQGGLSGTGRWRIARTWELRATYRKVGVCLFRTTDRQTFGQVRRAMVRALEANEMSTGAQPFAQQDDPV